MADAVTSQKIVDGPKNVVYAFTNISDGTGESAVLKVDVSALNGAPIAVRIRKVAYSTFGMGVQILWDATTDVVALVLNGYGEIDFNGFGGLPNNAGAGKTGDVLFTTLGATAGDSYTIVLEMDKIYS